MMIFFSVQNLYAKHLIVLGMSVYNYIYHFVPGISMATTLYPNAHIVCIVGTDSCHVLDVKAAPCNKSKVSGVWAVFDGTHSL